MNLQRIVPTKWTPSLYPVRQFSVGPGCWGRRSSRRMVSLENSDPEIPVSANDKIAYHLKNRNPMNLEKMRIGYRPAGFGMEKKPRSYWNKLELSLRSKHTSAVVTHWTGRPVCAASTSEPSISRFLYNNTDVAAIEAVAKVVGQRCLETGVHEVFLKVEEEDMKKEKMAKFVAAIEKTGLIINEGKPYNQLNAHFGLRKFKVDMKPWEIVSGAK